MDPSHCSVVVFSQPAPVPFVVEAEAASQSSSTINSEPAYTSLLQSVFGQVHVHGRHAHALNQTKQLAHTILLIDLDSIVGSDDDIDDDDNTTISTPASSSFSSPSCSTPSSPCSALPTTSDPRLYWIRKSAQFLHQSGVPVVVCSTRDDTALMLDCVHAGATDYLLKPLDLRVIKTLFLKLHRCRADSKISEAASSPAFLQPPPSLETTLSVFSPLCSDDTLRHRIQDMTIKSTRFTQTVIDIYTQSRTESIHYRNLSCERATFLKHQISGWDFNPFELPVIDLVHSAYLIFEQALTLPGLYDLEITRDRLYDFILDLSGAYYDGNPYHNFAHAVDVLQCTYFFLCRMGLVPFANDAQNETVPASTSATGFVHPLATTTTAWQQQEQKKPQDLLRPQDIFALLIAAIGHDAAHPGVNNAFLVNSASPLAMLYGDRSVLENFHTMALFHIIHKHGLDQIGGGPGSSDYQEFRKTVVTTILATDMSQHSDYINKFRSFSTDQGSDPQQDRLVLCSAIIKCSDISNVTRPFLRAARWAELLVQECVCQGDLERAMGLPSIPMNDRDSVVIEDCQIGFIRFVAVELFETVSQMLPDMDFTVDHIHDNLREWEFRKKAGSHDSGVASLEASSSSSHTTRTTTATDGIGGLKRRGSTNEAAFDVLRKRLSIDKDHHVARRRSSAGSVTEVLLAMPTYARMDHEDYVPQPQQPPPHPPYNAMFCQCCIQ